MTNKTGHNIMHQETFDFDRSLADGCIERNQMWPDAQKWLDLLNSYDMVQGFDTILPYVTSWRNAGMSVRVLLPEPLSTVNMEASLIASFFVAKAVGAEDQWIADVQSNHPDTDRLRRGPQEKLIDVYHLVSPSDDFLQFVF